MAAQGAVCQGGGVEAGAHRKLCTIELIAEGHADRCPGEECAFWSSGCALERVESELGSRPEVATMLLELRREVEAGREVPVAAVRERLVAASYYVGDEDGPAGGATELV